MKIKLSFLLLTTICLGCYTFSVYEDNTREGFNQNILSDKELHFMTKDEKEYHIKLHNIDSLNITGNGIVKDKYSDWRLFSGTVPLDSIKLVEVKKSSWAKSLLINTAAVSALWGFSEAFDKSKPELEIERSASSCPFIYSWNGSDYTLEGEAYGTAIGQALEDETVTVLPALRAENSILKIKIANERPETHYTDLVKLYAIQSTKDEYPVLDKNNVPWPVTHMNAPLQAVDHSGNDITKQVACEDNQLWQSDLMNTYPLNSFEDEIIITFKKPAKASQASLIIKSINTKFISSVIDQVNIYLGEQAIQFANELETNENLIKTFKEWIHFASLRASIWSAGSWQDVGLIYPEANEVSFKRLIKFSLPGNSSDEIKIRLQALSDVWKIDAIQVDYTNTGPLKWQEVPLLAVDSDLPFNSTEKIKNDDSNYLITFPFQKYILKYREVIPNNHGKITYALAMKGYSHEWITKEEKDQANLYPDADNRLDYLKSIFSYHSVLLPPVYKHWKEIKYKNKY